MNLSLRDNMELLAQRARLTLDNKSRSYIEDSKVYARLILDYIQLRLDHAQALENLSEVQEACSKLRLENRELKAVYNLPTQCALGHVAKGDQ